MMGFSSVESIRIPEGEVLRIAIGGTVVWKKRQTAENFRDLYQRVEYIASTSARTQYLTTDYIANNTTGLELVMSVPSFGDVICSGSRISGTDSRFYTPYPYGAARQYGGWNASRATSASLAVNTKYIGRVNWLNCRAVHVRSANDTLLGSNSFGTGVLYTQVEPICIFCASNGNGTRSTPRTMTLYGARISQGSEIVREYIPCYRKSDGEIGLYETYTGQFLTNAGTGSFAKGADVDW